MRSRFSAYAMENEAYLLATWHPDTRPEKVQFDVGQQWLGLKVKKHLPGASRDKDSLVEFVARFRINGRVSRLHEISRFRYENERWFYVNGQLVQKNKRR